MSDKAAFAFVETRTGPWRRTGSTFMAGDPPHGNRGFGRVAVATIWGDAQHEIPLAFTDDDGCVAVILSDLDATWAAAEAALPEGWAIILGPHLLEPSGYSATAAIRDPFQTIQHGAVGADGDTPAAALRALAAKLRERGAQDRATRRVFDSEIVPPEGERGVSDFRIDDAGIVWQPCPSCGQEVIPSHNGWRAHLPFCRPVGSMFPADPFRPRGDFDEGIQPDTLRGKALALMDETARVTAELEAAVVALPWYRRWPARALWAVARHRSSRERGA